ncbi:MAG: DNA cytosine methyltransferase [Candidatus Binatus sp.]|jgi:DNA (cytosine-5)-methyltransferase 1
MPDSYGTLVSLFSGAMGMDLGLEQAGFTTQAVVECDPRAVLTITLNQEWLRTGAPLILADKLDLANVRKTCHRILEKVPTLRSGGVDLLAGAPPCQPYSTAGKRLSMQDDRANGFDIFFNAVASLQPSYFIIENVSGVISAARQHRPLSERGPGFPPLLPAEQYGSAFRQILRNLTKLCSSHGYCATWGILNAADVGVAQRRHRLVIIGSKAGYSVWPTPTHSRDARGARRWRTMRDALSRLRETHPVYEQFTGRTKEFISHIPAGGNWRDLPSPLRAAAMGEAFKSWGGRSGFLRRLAWDEPAPTVTYSPLGRATLLCHPDVIRPLTVRECARLQGFPDHWQFAGTIRDQYRQIGNATPVGLAKAIGIAIRDAANLGTRNYHGEVLCAQPDLLERIGRRRKTVLNPTKMRPGSARESDRVWLGAAAGCRSDVKLYKARPPLEFIGRMS